MSPGFATLAAVFITGACKQNKGRLTLTILAIALGVALGTTVHLINHSAAIEFEAAIRATSGDAALKIAGPRSGIDEALYADFARREQIEVASPVLEFDAKLADNAGNLRILGLDPFRAVRLQPGLFGEAAERLIDLLRPNTVMLSETAARDLRASPGERLRVQAGLRIIELEVIAILPSGSIRQPLAVMDIASAQWAFDTLGRITRIDLRLRPGVSPAEFKARLATTLPPGVQIVTAERASEQGLAMSRAYRVNLNMLALVSLFAGAVLVFCTQTLSILRRRTHFALVRALGISSRELTMLLTTEALVLGLVGSAAGLALGVLGAHLAILYAGSDLGAGFFAGVIAHAQIDLHGLALVGSTGVCASLLGGIIPALEAARADPAHALRAGDEQRALTSLHTLYPALVIIAAGGLICLLPAVDGLPVFGYAGIACILLGALMLMPQYVRAFLRTMPRVQSPLQWLGIQQLRGSPGFAAISLAGILASFSLVVAMLIMIQSFRQSLDDWLGDVLPADLYLRAGASTSAWLDPQAQAAISRNAGIDRIVFSRHDTVLLSPDTPPVALIARDIDRTAPEALPLVTPNSPPPDDVTPAWISEAVRDVHGLKVGHTVKVPVRGQTLEVRIAGVWRDYVRQGGAIVVPRDAYTRVSKDMKVNEAWIWLGPGARPDAVMRELREALDAGLELEIRDPGRIRALSLTAFDRTFAVTYALQMAALVIGLFGISVGTSAQAIARRREFGMLHHLGLSIADLRRMVAIEGSIIGLLGACAGGSVGAVMSLVLIHVINRQSFHWTMEVHIPWSTLAALSAVLVGCAALTAAISVRRVLGPNVYRAVKEDW